MAAASVPAAPAELLARIRRIWEQARAQAARSVNTAHVCANWLIGQQIVEAEQRGARRAGYGQALLKTLSAELSGEFGSGFSVSALQYMRGFYLACPELLANQHALRVELDAHQAIQHAPRVESASEGMAAGRAASWPLVDALPLARQGDAAGGAQLLRDRGHPSWLVRAAARAPNRFAAIRAPAQES